MVEKAHPMVEKPKPAAPRDRRLPLSLVEFKTPVPVEGLQHPVRKFQRGEKLTEALVECPRLFLDPELQAVVIGDRHFPIGDVRYYERAKAA